jgi:hypothetical protein
MDTQKVNKREPRRPSDQHTAELASRILSVTSGGGQFHALVVRGDGELPLVGWGSAGVIHHR